MDLRECKVCIDHVNDRAIIRDERPRVDLRKRAEARPDKGKPGT